MNEIFFAPFIRGALIGKTKRPWIVSAAKHTDAAEVKSLPISINGEDDVIIAKTIRTALADIETIPAKIEICLPSKKIWYLTAPCYTGIEDIRSGKRQFWDASFFGAFKSRCDVVKNRVAMVTGGAQGFGEEIVRGLIDNGAFVYIADLNMDGARNLAQRLNTEKSRFCALPLEVNVGSEDSVRGMFETIAATTGGIDLCISNAGILRASSILEQDIPSFKLVTDINYVAFAIVAKYCALMMKNQNSTAADWMTDIVQINSKSGLEGSNKNGSYAGGKFGGIGLVQSFALELINYQIKVNAVCPGNFYDGPLWADPVKGLFVQYLTAGKVPGAKTVADVKTFYEAKSPIHRGCTGDDVLKAVLYIVEQCYETGQAVPVTGGQVMLH